MPPEAARLAEYGIPATPVGSVEAVVMTSGGEMVSVSGTLTVFPLRSSTWTCRGYSPVTEAALTESCPVEDRLTNAGVPVETMLQVYGPSGSPPVAASVVV